MLGAKLGARLFDAEVDYWYNNDDEERNKLQSQFPLLRLWKP